MSISHSIEERWMQQALALAGCGEGYVEPNPMVGAVVVSADGQLVGKGYHMRFGGPHAEVHALNMAGEAARGGTLYVTLEPCCHSGKTPPCTEAILQSGIRRVVVAMVDPFPKVAGGGVARLREAGLDVTLGLGEAEAVRLNAPYLKRIRTGRPWVIAKWAMSLDGKIATRTGDSRWISGEESRQRVHDLRGRVDAILVGAGTVRIDDPLLTARPAGRRLATRVVVTASGQLPNTCQLLSTARSIPVLVMTTLEHFTTLTHWSHAGAEIVTLPVCDGSLSMPDLLLELGRRGMTNVMVEGGAGLLGSLFDARMVDEAWVFVAPIVIGGRTAQSPVAGLGVGTIAEIGRGSIPEFERVGEDLCMILRFA